MVEGMRGMARRRAVSLSETSLVRTSSLDGRPVVEGDPSLPMLVSPGHPDVDLAAWAAGHRDEITAQLHRHGALLFRGFDLATAPEFERAASAIADGLYGDYGDLPREASGEKIFGSTPYPADLRIHFHNESSHMARWPMWIFFYCSVAAPDGGETPLLDCRGLCRWLEPELVDEFAAKGLTYVRNFREGIDVPWTEFFRTNDRAEVVNTCARDGATCEWTDGGAGLRIRQNAVAVRTHPVTGDRVFFNQVLLHHPAALPRDTMLALYELYDADSFPRNVTFGDGTPIADEAIAYLIDAFGQHEVSFSWRRGDVCMLDNMLVSHARAEFAGPRKILVAMAHIVEEQ